MQLNDNRLRLVKMDFLSLHHVPCGLRYEDSEFYNEQITDHAPNIMHDTNGNRLTLQYPNEPVKFPEHQTVILQILRANKLWVQYEKKRYEIPARNLHDMTAVVWGVSQKDHKVGTDQQQELCIEKLDDEVFLYLVLDQDFVVHCDHYYQNNRLAAVMSMQQYQTLRERSAYLKESVENMLELFYVEMWIGQTEQEAHDNQNIIDSSTAVSHRCFWLVDYAHVSVSYLEPTLCKTLFDCRTNITTYPRIVDFFEHVDYEGLLPYLTRP